MNLVLVGVVRNIKNVVGDSMLELEKIEFWVLSIVSLVILCFIPLGLYFDAKEDANCKKTCSNFEYKYVSELEQEHSYCYCFENNELKLRYIK